MKLRSSLTVVVAVIGELFGGERPPPLVPAKESVPGDERLGVRVAVANHDVGQQRGAWLALAPSRSMFRIAGDVGVRLRVDVEVVPIGVAVVSTRWNSDELIARVAIDANLVEVAGWSGWGMLSRRMRLLASEIG